MAIVKFEFSMHSLNQVANLSYCRPSFVPLTVMQWKSMKKCYNIVQNFT